MPCSGPPMTTRRTRRTRTAVARAGASGAGSAAAHRGVASAMAEYVYGVVRREAGRPSAVGVGGARPRLVAGDGAAALVSDLDGEDLQFGPDELRAHMRVLADAFASGTVLPMRFGVVMDDAEDVRRRLLERHAAELQRQLEALADKVEI